MLPVLFDYVIVSRVTMTGMEAIEVEVASVRVRVMMVRVWRRDMGNGLQLRCDGRSNGDDSDSDSDVVVAVNDDSNGTSKK